MLLCWWCCDGGVGVVGLVVLVLYWSCCYDGVTVVQVVLLGWC